MMLQQIYLRLFDDDVRATPRVEHNGRKCRSYNIQSDCQLEVAEAYKLFIGRHDQYPDEKESATETLQSLVLQRNWQKQPSQSNACSPLHNKYAHESVMMQSIPIPLFGSNMVHWRVTFFF